MKSLFILLSLAIGLFAVSETNAQTKIVFAKGASSKIITVTIPAKTDKSFSLVVKKNQVINVGLSGDIAVSKTNEFPTVSANLTNGQEDVDKWQDGEGYLSVLTGRNGTYIFNVSNSSNRARTVKIKVSVTNDLNDYFGGTE